MQTSKPVLKGTSSLLNTPPKKTTKPLSTPTAALPFCSFSALASLVLASSCTLPKVCLNSQSSRGEGSGCFQMASLTMSLPGPRIIIIIIIIIIINLMRQPAHLQMNIKKQEQSPQLFGLSEPLQVLDEYPLKFFGHLSAFVFRCLDPDSAPAYALASLFAL